MLNMDWPVIIPGAVIVLFGVGAVRWLSKLQERVNNHAERISHLEGRSHGRNGTDA